MHLKPIPNTHYQVSFLYLSVEKLNTCPFLCSWGTYICKVSPAHKKPTQSPFRESEYTYVGSFKYELHENKKFSIHTYNSFVLIPPPSCFAMCSKCIQLICSFVKSKLEHGAQDIQVEQVSIFINLCGTLKCKISVL